MGIARCCGAQIALAKILMRSVHRLVATGVLGPLIVFIRIFLRRILKDYFEYYECSRTHLALERDATGNESDSISRPGKVVELRRWWLHHRYEQRAAYTSALPDRYPYYN